MRNAATKSTVTIGKSAPMTFCNHGIPRGPVPCSFCSSGTEPTGHPRLSESEHAARVAEIQAERKAVAS